MRLITPVGPDFLIAKCQPKSKMHPRLDGAARLIWTKGNLRGYARNGGWPMDVLAMKVLATNFKL